MTPKLGSLFDGSGGFPLAGSLCGIEPVWAAEVEPYPIAVTKSRFPRMKHLGSVTDIKGGEIEPVDIITFGSPCQDLSVAGKRAGLKHEANGDEETTRSGLFMEAVRIIKEMRKATDGIYPAFALWENVPGAFSSNKGEDFRTVCEELIQIVEPGAVMPAVPQNGWPYADCYCGDGWSLAYRTFDAQHWGVPQRRRRIYLVLDLRGERAGKVLFERPGLRGYFAAGRTAWQGSAADAEGGPGAADRADVVIAFAQNQRDEVRDLKGIGGALAAEPGMKQQTFVVVHEQPVTDLVLDDQGGCIGLADVASTLRAGAGAPKHEQDFIGRLVLQPAVGLDLYNHAVTGDVSKAMTASASDADHVPCVMAKTWDARGNGDGETVSTITGDHERRPTDYSSVVVGGGECIPVHDKATRFNGGGPTRKNAAAGNGLGVGKPGDPAPTLSTCDRHIVAYEQPIVFDKEVYNSGINAAGGHYIAEGGPAPSLRTEHPPGVSYGVDCRNATEYPECVGAIQASMNHNLNSNGVVRVRYIVRRLTPTECARLQGFPDKWGHPDKKEDFTEEEYRFWLEVRNTHAAINDKAVKEYTKEQMLTWYNKLHTDSSEYKMWGNGIALPTALYCLQGMADALREE